ncbi:class III lanthionine synthetase LanKC [Streptomyces coacervatus]|uniref:non-specific serine/threonine protein kinase n=1 Tax=Streptomyces coacervatus TaxID=647381 RepID=A0ABP7HWV1_9ACTN|nr:class III lanthionine synthetase LanKC [Streptomyces coacervatus]MDF2270736.1 class III lanthionine synthetase LanKC [Streptomyces coacervatus]
MLHYLPYCRPGGLFYDRPAADEGSPAAAFGRSLAALPEGWRRRSDSDWTAVLPPAVELPRQGWKIHVSATLQNAEAVLETVWNHCVPRRVTFKYIRDTQVLFRRNSKYGDRSASGKFITVYPVDEAQLATLLHELGGLLDGSAGPYILSDLRWRAGCPLYVRYGAFVEQTVRDEAGHLVHCVTDPDGNLVPDHRGPGFRPPAWAPLPDCLTDSLAAREAGRLRDFPFRATRALHFSNGGGVYEAVDTRDEHTVLLKEARPLAGLDDTGADAVARLEREHWALRRLAGLSRTPRLVDYRIGNEHYFLAREFVPGTPLAQEIEKRNPLLAAGPDLPAADAAYARWALHILDEVEAGIREMHERGIVFGDLHPSNVLVRDNGGIAFIDYEASSNTADDAGQPIGAPGFRAPSGYRGTAVDRYALGCLRLALFVPLTVLVPWSPRKVDQFIEVARGHFPLPDDFADRVRADLGPCADAEVPGGCPPERSWAPDTRPDELPGMGRSIADGILACATPDREDRLYPGDIQQFRTPDGGLTFAYGAAGVLWALAEAGTPAPARHTDWLLRAARRMTEPRPGLYDGLAGVAYALDRLDRTDEALELLGRVDDAALDAADATLYRGLPGIGLTLAHLATRTGDRALLDAAAGIADRLVDAARGPAPSGRPRPGLLHGHTGAALFLLRLYEETGDAKLLHHAVEALRQDMADIGHPARPCGDEAPWRSPLLAAGSAGLGMVLHDALVHRPDPELAAARDAIRDVTKPRFVQHAGLFHGRAGLVLALAHMRDGDPEADAALRRHSAAFAWHSHLLDGRPAFFGDHALRLSTDLATGAAGVLLAGCAAADGSVGLPFLRPGTED